MNQINKDDALTVYDEALEDLNTLTEDQLESVGGGIGDCILVKTGG